MEEVVSREKVEPLSLETFNQENERGFESFIIM
jgi:hypothetical protein